MLSRTTPTYSKETQNLLKTMMEESKLTLFQQRQLRAKLKSGSSLPTTVNPTSSGTTVSKPKPQRQTKPKFHSKRSKEVIEILQTEDTETELLPRPCKPGRDVKVEKEKLQNIMAYGDPLKGDAFGDQIKSLRREEPCDNDDIDMFEEVMNEIRERQEFLKCVHKHGEDREMENLILTEISQKVRDLKQIDTSRAEIALTEIVSNL